MSQYEPFGKEWRTTVKRMKKDDIISFYRKVCLEKQALQIELDKINSYFHEQSQREQNKDQQEHGF